MTDQQFERFLDAVNRFQESREMIIRIDENTKEFRAWSVKHDRDDSEFQAIHRQAIEALHMRLDNFGRFQYLAMGGVGLLAYLVAQFGGFIVESVFKL